MSPAELQAGRRYALLFLLWAFYNVARAGVRDAVAIYRWARS